MDNKMMFTIGILSISDLSTIISANEDLKKYIFSQINSNQIESNQRCLKLQVNNVRINFNRLNKLIWLHALKWYLVLLTSHLSEHKQVVIFVYQ